VAAFNAGAPRVFGNSAHVRIIIACVRAAGGSLSEFNFIRKSLVGRKVVVQAATGALHWARRAPRERINQFVIDLQPTPDFGF